MNELRDLKIEGIGTSYGGEYNEVKFDGISKLKDSLKCKLFSSEGMCKSEAEIIADIVKIEGTFNSKANIKAKKISIEGLAKFEKSSISAEEIKAEGSITCSEFSADKIKIDGICKAEKMFGESIEIYSKSDIVSGVLNFFNNSDKSKVQLIECTELKADGLIAYTIRASRVKLGKNCEVNLVEYSESVDIHPEAKVKEIISI